jgi:hypothetical protein
MLLAAPLRTAELVALILIASAAMVSCGGDGPQRAGGAGATPPDRAGVNAAEPTPSAAERAARERTAARKQRAAAKRKAERRNQARGGALLQDLIDNGTRERWSVMSVAAKGGLVTVYTDLPPGSGGFTGACEALKAREPWIETIEVHGTDGLTHGSWAKGDAACQAV